MGGTGGATGLELGVFTEILEGADESQRVVLVAPAELEDSPYQPKGRQFDPERNREDREFLAALRDRYERVGERAIIQPLLVRLLAAGGYGLIEGHRRKYAALDIGIPRVPVVVATVDELEAAVQTGLANMQRAQLTPLQEGYQLLAIMNVTGESATAAGARVGMAERTAQQRVQLTQLPATAQALLEQGALSIRQALACENEAWGGQVAELASKYALTQEQIGAIVQKLQGGGGLSPEAVMREVVGEVLQMQAKAAPRSKKRAEKPALDYGAIVEELAALGLSTARRATLAEYAGEEGLSRVGVRWAALMIAGSGNQRTSSAVVYADQLQRTPIGKTLRAQCEALERLEKWLERGEKQLTPNVAEAGRVVIEDVVVRLNAASAAMEEALGAVCAATMPEGED